MRYLITLAGVLLLSHTVPANDYDFRKTRWDMPLVQVKAIESLNYRWKFSSEKSAKNAISKTLMVYTGRIFNHKCILVYQFTQGRLSEGAYNFNVEKLDIPELKDLYTNILKTLSNKYGDGTPFKNTGMKWFTTNKRTEILLQYNEKHDSIQIMYFSRVNKPANNTLAEDAF